MFDAPNNTTNNNDTKTRRQRQKLKARMKSTAKKTQKSAFEIEICHEISFTYSPFHFAFDRILWIQLVSVLLIFFFVRSSVLLPSPLLVQRYPIFILLWYRKLLSSSFGTIGIRFQFRFENAFAFNRFCLSISALNIYLWMAWWCCHFSLETALPFNLGANLALSCVYCASHRISRTEKQIKNVCADDLHANVCLCVTQFPPKRNWQFCFLSCSMFSS